MKTEVVFGAWHLASSVPRWQRYHASVLIKHASQKHSVSSLTLPLSPPVSSACGGGPCAAGRPRRAQGSGEAGRVCGQERAQLRGHHAPAQP